MTAPEGVQVLSQRCGRGWRGADDFLAGRSEQVTATTTVSTVSNDTDGDGEVDAPR